MLSKYDMENLKNLIELAASGDAAAQYRLAAHYDRSGKEVEARQWTEKAAAAGHPGALYTQATQLLSARPEDLRIGEAVTMLSLAADAGGAAALRQLAVLSALGLGVERNWKSAVARLAQAARLGHPAAMRELAVLAAIGGDRQTSAALLREAAFNGDWIAIYLALRRGDVLSDEEGKGHAAKMRGAGVPLAQRLSDPQGKSSVVQEVDFREITAAAAKVDPAGCIGEAKTLNTEPAIVLFEKALTVEECDYIICASAALLTPSKVVNPETSKADHAQYRTSDGAMFGLLDLDLTLIAIYARLAQIAGVPVENCELMGILRYAPGQEYFPHHDFLPEDAEDYSEVRRSGQRTRTLLISLNDEYEGGETKFPKLDITLRGAPGDAFVFHNTDDREQPYAKSLHAGAPVKSGEKWLLTLWCRARPFWFWV